MPSSSGIRKETWREKERERGREGERERGREGERERRERKLISVLISDS